MAEEGFLPPVPMAEHLRIVQAHATASVGFTKAKSIIEVMKGQIGQVNATLAETQVELAEALAQCEAARTQASELEKRAEAAESARDNLQRHADALELQIAEARAQKQ